MNYELKKLFSKVLNSFFCYVRFVYALEFITKHPPYTHTPLRQLADFLRRGNSYTNVIMAQYTLKLKLNH